MTKHSLVLAICLGVLTCARANAQATLINNCPYKNHATSLACLIPDVTKTGGSTNLGNFNTTIAQVLGQLPLAVPISGFALSFDRATGIYIISTDNLGSVLTERGDTIGKHKLFLGFTYQRFVFQNIDGTSLSKLPIVFSAGGAANVYGSAQDGLSTNINQYTPVVAFGLTDRVDVSLILPFERVSVGATQNNLREFSSTGVQFFGPQSVSVAGSASGPGDLLLNLKGTVYKGEKLRTALGTEFRFPTGNAFNLLGSGAYGIKPYVVISRRGRITPHANVGYQWNGFSDLYPNPDAAPLPGGALPTLKLPSDLDYSAGADIGIMKRLTVVADLVGQHYFDAPRVTPAVPASSLTGAEAIKGLPPALANTPTVGIQNGAYDADNFGVGIKVNPIGKLLVSANVLIKLNNGGLRSNYIPLVGVSYKF
jgi:hypothetical protein